MRLLLDTHIWLWQSLAPERLSQGASDALADPDNELFLSTISVWELLFLVRKGRISLNAPADTWARRALQRAPLTVLSLDLDGALRVQSLAGWAHRDPADRFITATALVHGLTIATADEKIRAYEGASTLW